MKQRGKPGGVILCALGHRANRLAFAMMRDQVEFDPDRWPGARSGRNPHARPRSTTIEVNRPQT